MSRRHRSSDPRRLGGDIAGPGGTQDTNAVVMDTTNAVLLDNLTVAVMHGKQAGDVFTLLLEGRINRSPDRTRVLYMFDADGLAALVTEATACVARAERNGLSTLAAGFNSACQDRMRKLRKDGAL